MKGIVVKENITKSELYALLEEHGVIIGTKCKVFDGLSWSKKGDIGDNECYYVDAVVLDIGKTDFNEVTVDVLMENGRISTGHYLEGIRHCI